MTTTFQISMSAAKGATDVNITATMLSDPMHVAVTLGIVLTWMDSPALVF